MPRKRVRGGLKVVGDRVQGASHALNQGLDAAEHAVEEEDEVSEFVPGRAFRYPGREVAGVHDPAGRLREPVDRVQGLRGEEVADEEAQGEERDEEEGEIPDDEGEGFLPVLRGYADLEEIVARERDARGLERKGMLRRPEEEGAVGGALGFFQGSRKEILPNLGIGKEHGLVVRIRDAEEEGRAFEEQSRRVEAFDELVDLHGLGPCPIAEELVADEPKFVLLEGFPHREEDRAEKEKRGQGEEEGEENHDPDVDPVEAEDPLRSGDRPVVIRDGGHSLPRGAYGGV